MKDFELVVLHAPKISKKKPLVEYYIKLLIYLTGKLTTPFK